MYELSYIDKCCFHQVFIPAVIFFLKKKQTSMETSIKKVLALPIL